MLYQGGKCNKWDTLSYKRESTAPSKCKLPAGETVEQMSAPLRLNVYLELWLVSRIRLPSFSLQKAKSKTVLQLF